MWVVHFEAFKKNHNSILHRDCRYNEHGCICVWSSEGLYWTTIIEPHSKSDRFLLRKMTEQTKFFIDKKAEERVSWDGLKCKMNNTAHPWKEMSHILQSLLLPCVFTYPAFTYFLCQSINIYVSGLRKRISKWRRFKFRSFYFSAL